MDVVRGHFRPEFLNRLDEIILFHRLRRNTWRRLSRFRWAGCKSCSLDRKITLDLDGRSAALDRPGWL
jgi:ATP-dependent Clp protease ATP-binding subunit ClpB